MVINLFGGPGIGKTTLATGLYSELKKRNYSVELVSEFAREKILENNMFALEHQFYISSTQLYKQLLAQNRYSTVITDSPFILGCFYDKTDDIFLHTTLKNFLLTYFNKQKNVNFLLDRKFMFQKDHGRVHSLEQSLKLDEDIKNFLTENKIEYTLVASINEILENIE